MIYSREDSSFYGISIKPMLIGTSHGPRLYWTNSEQKTRPFMFLFGCFFNSLNIIQETMGEKKMHTRIQTNSKGIMRQLFNCQCIFCVIRN